VTLCLDLPSTHIRNFRNSLATKFFDDMPWWSEQPTCDTYFYFAAPEVAVQRKRHIAGAK